MKRYIFSLVCISLGLYVFCAPSAYCEDNLAEETAAPISEAQQVLNTGFKNIFEDGNPQAAIIEFEKVVVLEPGNSQAYFGLGSAYFMQGDTAKAEKYFNKAILADFENAAAYEGLGNCYFWYGDYKKAREYYEKAIVIDKERPWVYFHLGRLYSLTGNKNAALKQAEILAGLDKDLEKKLREQIAADNP
ncbi:MAG: tetratricopeptide repeat protein [Candidatus Omnitrophica bacterium]|nr:tetratricopeptide repeat protein [Candidatus Omnitrophota bacterium]